MNCEIKIAETKGSLSTVTGDELTVGRPFGLMCTGELPALNPEKLELRLEQADQYKLKLLKFEKRSETEIQLLVTSYQAGDHQIKAVQLIDADHSVVLGDLQFTVKSVLNPTNPEKEPFGPMGPLVFGIPLGIKVATGILLLVLLALASWKWFVRARRKKWLLSMKLYEKVLPPMAELGKTLRLAQKELNLGGKVVQDLDQGYRIYLARIFNVPTFHFSDKEILQKVRSWDSDLYQQEASLMQKTLAEIKRASVATAGIAQRDLEQLIQLVRRSAEHIEQHLDHKKRMEK